MDVHLPKRNCLGSGTVAAIAHRHILHEVAAHHNHPRYPEEQDVEAGNQLRRRVEHIEIARVLGPAERGKRKQRRREPGVQNVGFLLNGKATGGALEWIFATHNGLRVQVALRMRASVIRAVPGWNAMSPPELARDAPVVDLIHPVQVDGLVILRREANVTIHDRGDRPVCQRLNLDEPLHREAGLDNIHAAAALADREHVILGVHQESLDLKISEHSLARFVAIEPGIGGTVLVDARELVHDLQHRQVVSFADHEVVRIMRRRHLHRTCPEFGIREFIGNNRDLAIDQRKPQLLANQLAVSLIIWTHGHGNIA